MLNSKRYLTILIILSVFFVLRSEAFSKESSWLTQQTPFAYEKITVNLSPKDGGRGAVIAATSSENPNYHYHWVRDAGIVMDALLDFYQHYAKANERQKIRQQLMDYRDFSSQIQNVKTLADLGEPKFYVDGTVFNEPWGRPQNDGPALRAISLLHWAKILIAEGNIAYVKEKLYNSNLPAVLPIKKDLEYISHHWQDQTYDLWEEVKGKQFYSLMVSRRALIEGARLAEQLNDKGAAEWYKAEVKAIELELQLFWDPTRGYFVATLDREAGIDYKQSNLDSAVMLGLLHGDMHDGFFAWDDVRVVSTINQLIKRFSALYPINQRQNIPGYAIGRYPEDKYSGIDFNGGNPWVICTLGMAEALYRYAHTLKDKGEAEEAKKIIKTANDIVMRVKYHAYPDGSLSEQINRYSGYMISAENLTWNYAALVTSRLASEFKNG